jgi:hypothetical protein
MILCIIIPFQVVCIVFCLALHIHRKMTNYLFFMLMLRYYEGLQRCVGLYSENGQFSPDEIDRLDTLYKTLGQQFKRSSAVKVAQSILVLYSIVFFLV